jgi:hypothetical protein
VAEASESSVAEGRERRWLAAVSAVLGAAAAAGAMLIATRAFLGPHLLPTERDCLWRMPAMFRWFWPTLSAAVAGIAISAATRRRPESGRRAARLAKDGLALCVGASALVLLSVLAFPVWTGATASARRAQCLSHIHHLSLALEMYVSDWGRYPEAAKWCDVTLEYVPDRTWYRCPEAPGECGYAYNSALDRKLPDTANGIRDLVVIFESDGGWNAHGGRELLPPFPRHSGADAVAFAGDMKEAGAFCAGLTGPRQRQRPEGEARWDTTWPRRYQHPLEWRATPTEGAR